MKPIKLIPFLKKIAEDKRLYNSHSCLLVAMLSLWEQQKFQVPFFISRKKLMHLAKVNSTATYHKCLKELVTFGYIFYQPSYHPHKGSKVSLR
jgi:hypothetical protein